LAGVSRGRGFGVAKYALNGFCFTQRQVDGHSIRVRAS
jgi:hypothetical protein